jgi:DNA polymerase-4
MENSLNRRIIHIHIPAFHIAIERADRPELRGRPVAVAPPQSDRALILSASPEAGQEGVFKGMALGKAMRLCPDLTVLPPNPPLLEKGCRLLAGMAARYTPIWEASGPGHMYMDVTGTERLWGRAKDAACRIERDIGDGLAVPAAAGVASNKMVSNIASRLMASKGVLDVDPGRESSFMAPLKVDYLPGVGHTRRKILLEDLNITLVREIAVLDSSNLRLIFGQQAWLIHQRALGIDPTPVHPPSSIPSVSESSILPNDENDDRILLGVIYSLVERCSRRLRSGGLWAYRAGLVLRYSDQIEVTRRTSLPHGSNLDLELYVPLKRLFFKACQRRVAVRFIRVRFWDFSAPSPQISLFLVTDPDREKKGVVAYALDSIRKRYGNEAIKYGIAA